MKGSAARHGLLLIAVALAARLAFALALPAEIVWPDGREFDAVARELADHGRYGPQTLRPPGYPTLMAGVYRVVGTDLVALRVVESALGAVAVAVIAGVGRAAFGPAAGWIAGWLAALHPVLAFLPSSQYSENTLVLVLVLAWAALLAARARGGWRWALAGALFGAAALVRPNAVTLLPGLAVALAIAPAPARRRLWLPAAAFLAAWVLVLAPWTVRNHAVHGRWFFVATGGGRQFWLGNNPAASALTTSYTRPDSALTAELAALPDDPARERLYYDRGLQFVREQPGRALHLYLVKLGNLFALFPETYSRTPFMNNWARASQGAVSVVIFAGALLAVLRRRAPPATWLLVGAVVSFAFANSVFFTVLRYRMAFEPCLLWLAGAGWAPLLAGDRRPSASRLSR